MKVSSWAALVVALLLLPVLPASSHASLTATDPADGAELAAAPSSVTLTFSEPVEVPTGAIRVFDSAGQRVDAGDSGHGESPEEVAVSMPADSPEGPHVVTWRVVSLDGHPLRGAFMFQVGEGRGADEESLLAALLGQDEETPWTAASSVVRWVTYLAALTAAGAAVFDRWLRTGREPRLSRLIMWTGAIGVVGSIFQVPVFATEVTGLGWQAWVSPSALGDAVTSPVAVSAGMRVGGLALLIWAVRKRAVAVAVAVAIVVGSELVSGHTLTTEPQWLVMSADAIHVAAAALWLGGLVGLYRLLSRREDAPARAASTLGRFSTMATWSVVALVIAGVTLAWAEVRAFWALTATTYGWTLLAKVAVAAVVLGVALYNNRVLVPAVGRDVDPTGEGASGAWRTLRKVVRIEVMGLAIVLGLTAVLVNVQPAAEAAGVSGPYSVYLPFEEGELNLVVDPNRRGTNQVHAYVLSRTGSPRDVQGEATMEFTFVDEEVGPLVRRPQPAGPGHWIHTGPELAIAGTWQIEFRLGEGLDESSAVAEVRVSP